MRKMLKRTVEVISLGFPVLKFLGRVIGLGCPIAVLIAIVIWSETGNWIRTAWSESGEMVKNNLDIAISFSAVFSTSVIGLLSVAISNRQETIRNRLIAIWNKASQATLLCFACLFRFILCTRSAEDGFKMKGSMLKGIIKLFAFIAGSFIIALAVTVWSNYSHPSEILDGLSDGWTRPFALFLVVGFLYGVIRFLVSTTRLKAKSREERICS